ncbi:hypothetical protein B296_00001783 [Ensete ventricosum]|uniref:Uncharacterized protein n=1 Tax=Ensete ventricosum TaxID=4639 RepID=A0A427ABA8_ENSVE|nr:hypothetical protein B296_00001783 [Ensete ventricosum]
MPGSLHTTHSNQSPADRSTCVAYKEPGTSHVTCDLLRQGHFFFFFFEEARPRRKRIRKLIASLEVIKQSIYTANSIERER